MLAVERMQKEKSKDSVAQAKTKLIAEIEDIVKQADEDYKGRQVLQRATGRG